MAPFDPHGDREPLELRSRILDASERLAELETERFALEELCDGLEAKERDLERRIAGFGGEEKEQRGEIETKEQRAQALMAEADAVRRETISLERECTDRALRIKDLEKEATALADRLRSHRDEGEAVEGKLQAMRDRIARMDRKLDSAERKRAVARPHRAGGTAR